MRRAALVPLFGLSTLLIAAPVPQPAIKIAPIPPADPDAAQFDKPPKGALVRLGSRQMRHPGATLCDYPADGHTLFTAGYGMIREWDTDTHTLRRSIPLTDTRIPERLGSTPDGGKLLFRSERQLHVWDRTTKKRLHLLTVPEQTVFCHAVSPDGKTVAVGTEEGHAVLFDLASGKLLKFDVTHPSPPPVAQPPVAPGDPLPPSAFLPLGIGSLAWSPNGKTLVTSSGEGVRAWDRETGKERWALEKAAGYWPVAFTTDGKHVLAPIIDAEIRPQYALWDATTGEKTADLKGFFACYRLAVSADGKHFASVDRGSELQVWDVEAEKVKFAAKMDNSVGGLAFSRDGKTLACSSSGAHLFDVATGKELLDDTGHAGEVLDVRVTPDGALAATVGTEGTARVWDTATGKQLHAFRPQRPGRLAVCLSPDGKALALSDYDVVRVVDLKSGDDVWKAEGLGHFGQVMYSPDGKTLALAGWDLTVHLWDAKSGDPIRKLVGSEVPSTGTTRLAWTPDSTGLVSAVKLKPVPAAEGQPNLGPALPGQPPFGPALPARPGQPGGDGAHQLVLWDVKTGEKLRTLGEPMEECHAKLAVSPDGKHLAVGRDAVTLLELKTGKQVWTADVPGTDGVAFTADGTLYAGPVCLSVKTGKKESELFTDRGHGHFLGDRVAVPLNGKTVLTAADDDNTVLVWPR